MSARIMLVVAVAVVASGVPFWAQCRCGDYPAIEEALARSDAVFVGTVIDAERQWNVLNWTTAALHNWFRVDGRHQVAPRSKIVATLAVNEVIKGTVSESMTVHTYPGDAWCGTAFEVGQSYLVYAHRTAWQLWSGKCSRSGDADEATNEIETIRRLSGAKPHNSRLNPTVGPVTGLAGARPAPAPPAG